MAVPGEYPQDVTTIGLGNNSLAKLCSPITITQAYRKVPVYVRPPWAVYSGTQGPALVAEGGDISSARPQFEYR